SFTPSSVVAWGMGQTPRLRTRDSCFPCSGRALAGDPPEPDCTEQAVARKITPDMRARDAARRAAAGEHVSQRQDARVLVDGQAALGMEQGAADPDRVVGRHELRLAREVAAEGVLRFSCCVLFHFAQGAAEMRKLRSGTNRAGCLSIAIVGEGHAELMQALVVDAPGDAAGLPQDRQALLRIAKVLVGESLTAFVDLNSTFGH